MKGTFFVNAYLDSYYPETEVEEIVKNIVDRGHDVQLHTHEEFRCFSICALDEKGCWDRCTRKESYLAGNTLDNQTAIIKEGAQNIAKWSGRYPVAFRGGGFDADINTLSALRALNIPIDSSLSQPGHPLATVYPINQVSEWKGVVEVPLFNYTEDLIFRKSIRFLDIESTTLLEQKYLLDEAAKNDIRTVVLLMHSFSFCRPGLGCPIRENIDRFDKLLEHIKKTSEIEVITFREFWNRYQDNPEQFRGDANIPTTNYLHTLHRSFVRFDQGIKNKIFFIVNLVLLVSLFILIAYFAIMRFLIGNCKGGY